MVILLVGGGAVFLLPSRHSRDGNTGHETFNANAESALTSVSAIAGAGAGEGGFTPPTPGGGSSPTARPGPRPATAGTVRVTPSLQGFRMSGVRLGDRGGASSHAATTGRNEAAGG